MPLTAEQKQFINELKARDDGMGFAHKKITLEDVDQLYDMHRRQKQLRETNNTFFSRVKRNLTERFSKTFEGSTAEATGPGLQGVQMPEVGPFRGAMRLTRDIAGIFNDILGAAIEPKAKEYIEKAAETKIGQAGLNALAGGMEKWEEFKQSGPIAGGFAETVEAAVNVADVIGAGKIATSVGKAGAKAGRRVVFDVSKSVPERIKAVRAILPESVSASKTTSGLTEKMKGAFKSFTERPEVTGTIDNMKVMVGLPESAPAVDMTFRAIKPRITKGTNLRRVKTQMELANETIAKQGFKPSSVREYADAIYDTKKNVWSEIETKLKAGDLANRRVDLTSIAVDLLNRADDTALLRTSPQAAKQITKIAENLVSFSDDVSVLEAERIKQLLNAELDGSFGTLDISQQAKEAKKHITNKIGEQLNEVLSDIPDEFKDLKTKYGALSSVEEDALKRAIVFERQNPEGLADMLTKTEAAAEMVFGNTKGRLRAVARLTMGKRLKKANDANELIKRAFEKLLKNVEKSDLPQAGATPDFKKAIMPEMVNSTNGIAAVLKWPRVQGQTKNLSESGKILSARNELLRKTLTDLPNYKERLLKAGAKRSEIESGKITMYRATELDQIYPGDFVTPDKNIVIPYLNQRIETGRKAKILKKKIPIENLLIGDEYTDFVFAPDI